MTRVDYVKKYTGKFILVHHERHDDNFYIYAKNDKKIILFRPVGTYSFNFDLLAYAAMFASDQDYTTIEITKTEWMRKVIPCIFSIN